MKFEALLMYVDGQPVSQITFDDKLKSCAEFSKASYRIFGLVQRSLKEVTPSFKIIIEGQINLSNPAKWFQYNKRTEQINPSEQTSLF